MNLNPFKKQKSKSSSLDNNTLDNDVSKINVVHKSDILKKEKPEIYQRLIKEKKEALGSNILTREELLKTLQEEIRNKKYSENNPFKTREDYFISFFNEKMGVDRRTVPFESITIAGKEFLIHKEYRNGDIIVKELYPYPQLEINLEEEIANKETTKQQLERINKQLLYIKKQISLGKDEYRLIDIEDLKEEKIKLEKTLESIKYGKCADFTYEDPVTRKNHLWMKRKNGEYVYLKVTENNYIVEENSVRQVKGNSILKQTEYIINMRKTLNLKQIFLSIIAFVMFCVLCFGMWNWVTFDDVLFDKRVSDAVNDRTIGYQKEIDYYRAIIDKNNIAIPKDRPLPNYSEPN